MRRMQPWTNTASLCRWLNVIRSACQSHQSWGRVTPQNWSIVEIQLSSAGDRSGMFCVTYMADGVEQRRHDNPDERSFFDEECCEPGNLDQVVQESAFPTAQHPPRTNRAGNPTKPWHRATAVSSAPGSSRSPSSGFDVPPAA